MNISHAKTKLSIAALAVALLAGAGASTLAVSAAETVLGEKNAALFLPSSYEQYLELEKPSVFDFSEHYIAIADEGTLYIYDRAAGSYFEKTLKAGHTVTQLGFAGDRLFVSDREASNFFYEFNFETRELEMLSGINCSTFVIDGGTLYTASVGGQETTIASYDIGDLYKDTLSSPTLLGTVRSNTAPSMTTQGGKLYCAFGYIVHYQNAAGKFDEDTWFILSTDSSELAQVQSVCALGDHFYYTAVDGLYRTDRQQNNSRIVEGRGFATLTSFGENLYMVQGDAIKELSITEDGAAFSGYEITSYSDSLNRLNSAVDTVRAGNLLVTADAGNRRVTVYNFVTGKYTQILSPEGKSFLPAFVATDGALIAAASGNVIYTCTYTGDETMYFTQKSEPTQSAIRGLTCVYGAVYYVTGNAYGKLGEDEVYHDGYGTPAALTSDVYGDLFVVYETSRAVIRFAESDFAIGEARGEILEYTLPAGYTSLRADFEGNLYYLIGNTVYRNGGKDAIATLHGSDFVYTMSEHGPISFALGFEDDEVYFLFGDYIVGSLRGALDIPTLSEISCEGVYESVFRPHGKENLFVDIPAGTIGIRTDLAEMRAEDPEYFPYSFYFRTEEAARGILLSAQNGYALVVIFEVRESSRIFTANLFRIDPEDYIVSEEVYWTEGGSARYLTSDVSAYFFPCLPPALADARLTRGTRVTVVGTVHAPERDYALVEYTTPARTLMHEYVPSDYLTDVNPIATDIETTIFGRLKNPGDGHGYLFIAQDGEAIYVEGGTQVRLYDNGDGFYTARYTDENGKVYSSVVPENLIEWGESDALRISLIVILSVLAILIIALYIYFLPRSKKKQ